MTVVLYDANNVLLRDLTRAHGPGSFISIRARYEKIMHSSDIELFVFDGKAHNARRRALYPHYKLGRAPVAEDHYAHITLFKELLAHSRAHLVECPGWEADDVVASLAEGFTHRAQAVTIHTNDADYGQLLCDPLITLEGVKTPDYAPRYVPLYKATVGDPSDNIKGIPGFGAKAWEAMASRLPDLEEAVRFGQQELLLALPFNGRALNWLANKANVAELRAMYQITQFIPVPRRELELGLSIGSPSRESAEALLQRFLL